MLHAAPASAPARRKERKELAVGGVALALAHDVFEVEIGRIVGLDVEDADELRLERVFAGRIHHLLLDLGILGTESDEDQLVATNAFARRKSVREGGEAEGECNSSSACEKT